jgi:hypothetical protein
LGIERRSLTRLVGGEHHRTRGHRADRRVVTRDAGAGPRRLIREELERLGWVETRDFVGAA